MHQQQRAPSLRVLLVVLPAVRVVAVVLQFVLVRHTALVALVRQTLVVVAVAVLRTPTKQAVVQVDPVSR